MKKTILFFAFAAILLTSAFGEYTYSITNAIVRVPWNVNLTQERTPPSVTFSDGSTKTFYYCTFIESSVELPTACVNYNEKYNELLNKMLNGVGTEVKITSAMAENNIAKWATIVNNIITEGIGLQEQINNEAIKKIESDYAGADESILSEIEDAYSKAVNEAENKIASEKSSLAAEIADIRTSQAASAQTLQNNISTATAALNAANENLASKLNSTAAEVASAKAAVEKAALTVQENTAALSSVQSRVSNLSTTISSASYVGSFIYSNTISQISHYIGATNTNNGFFHKRRSIYDDSKTVDTMYDHLNEIGVTSVTTPTMRDHTNSTSFFLFDYGFDVYTNDNGVAYSLTNISVPSNWVDGTTIICTNGYYEVDIAGDASSIGFSMFGSSSNKLELAGWSSITQGVDFASNNLVSVLGKTDDEYATNLVMMVKDLRTNKLVYFPVGRMDFAYADDRSLEETNIVDEATGKTNTVMQMYGFAAATNESAKVGDGFADKIFSTDPSNWIVPVKEGGDGTIKWVPLANYTLSEQGSGMEKIVSSNRQEQIDRYITLAHWGSVTNAESSNYEHSIGDMLMTADEATNILILAKSLDDKSLRYIKLGGVKTDNMTICSTNLNGDANNPTNALTLVGFYDADTGNSPVKVYDADLKSYRIAWTNFTERNPDNLSIQYWHAEDDTNDVYMVKGFVEREAEAKDLSEYMLGDEDVGDGKLQVLARRVAGDGEITGETTNTLSLVYIDIGNTETNESGKTSYKRGLRKLRKSMEALTNELFSAGGFTNAFNNVTNRLWTSPFDVIAANNLLDNASVWTNGQRLIEVKGFGNAGEGTYPVRVKDDDLSTSTNVVYKLKWQHVPIGDSDISGVGDDFYGTTVGASIEKKTLFKHIDDGAGGYDTSTNYFQIRRFDIAPNLSVPMCDNGGDDLYGTNDVLWAMISTNQLGISGRTVFTRIVGLNGFDAATSNQVPYKKWISGEGAEAKYELGWMDNDSSFVIELKGTDGNSVYMGSGSVTNTVETESETNSNVTVKFSKADGVIKMKIGVYYK